ncbi:hypothetical protein Q0590_33940 [Rhodocytophaga aerolata]|uniref:Outer membrane beta-barrel protein n=1 Tax=Rhodocytophaga aerolata TaxID=455078 RepID=A0ABT8RGU6_9BACT|nr:hypothetical protein [Rhodocytophaga aerolata]MDO1451326.1 hypothetical protein [Rhodocytophaga aerolata]
MKTFVVLFLVVASVSLSFGAYSQNKKGNILLAAYADPLLTKRTFPSPPGSTSHPLNIRTHIKGGYHLFNRFALGASLSYNYQSGRGIDFDDTYYNREQLTGVFARYMIPVQRFGIIAEGGYSLGRVKNNIPRNDQEVPFISGLQAYHWALGINYRLGKAWLLEVMARQEKGSYNRELLLNGHSQRYLNGGFMVGTVYYLNCK